MSVCAQYPSAPCNLLNKYDPCDRYETWSNYKIYNIQYKGFIQAEMQTFICSLFNDLNLSERIFRLFSKWLVLPSLNHSFILAIFSTRRFRRCGSRMRRMATRRSHLSVPLWETETSHLNGVPVSMAEYFFSTSSTVSPYRVPTHLPPFLFNVGMYWPHRLLPSLCNEPHSRAWFFAKLPLLWIQLHCFTLSGSHPSHITCNPLEAAATTVLSSDDAMNAENGRLRDRHHFEEPPETNIATLTPSHKLRLPPLLFRLMFALIQIYGTMGHRRATHRGVRLSWMWRCFFKTAASSLRADSS